MMTYFFDWSGVIMRMAERLMLTESSAVKAAFTTDVVAGEVLVVLPVVLLDSPLKALQGVVVVVVLGTVVVVVAAFAAAIAEAAPGGSDPGTPAPVK